jgi:hypothetical protein
MPVPHSHPILDALLDGRSQVTGEPSAGLLEAPLSLAIRPCGQPRESQRLARVHARSRRRVVGLHIAGLMPEYQWGG